MAKGDEIKKFIGEAFNGIVEVKVDQEGGGDRPGEGVLLAAKDIVIDKGILGLWFMHDPRPHAYKIDDESRYLDELTVDVKAGEDNDQSFLMRFTYGDDVKRSLEIFDDEYKNRRWYIEQEIENRRADFER